MKLVDEAVAQATRIFVAAAMPHDPETQARARAAAQFHRERGFRSAGNGIHLAAEQGDITGVHDVAERRAYQLGFGSTQQVAQSPVDLPMAA